MNNETYQSPLSNRYGSNEMKKIFSPHNKYTTWRKLWVELASAECELGAPVTAQQVQELLDNVYNINYEVAEEFEKETHHDVMAHVKAYGVQCPNAAGIIHLGATSSYITDNADIIIMVEAIKLVRKRLVKLICSLSEFVDKYKSTPTLGYTHYQPAQPTTVGKRACMWLQDLYQDLDDLDYVLKSIRLLGSKGATGTQASFLKLFNSYIKIYRMEKMIADAFGFEGCYPISGQTYPRKLDMRIYNVLSGIAVTVSKMCNDIRLLQHDGEMSESFSKSQVGSSAMAYKQNPINCEKVVGLSRRVITDSLNPALTASVQWLERTLDDSSNRRLVLADGFITIDEILVTCNDIIDNIVVREKVIEENLNKQLPYMLTENIMMVLVERGMSRQDAHEKIREISMKSRNGEEGYTDILFALSFNLDIPYNELKEMLGSNKYTGRAEIQVKKFLHGGNNE